MDALVKFTVCSKIMMLASVIVHVFLVAGVGFEQEHIFQESTEEFSAEHYHQQIASCGISLVKTDET